MAECLACSKRAMFSIVVAAMFSKALFKESLVTGNNHIGKGEQPREHVALISNLRFTAES